MSSGIARTDVAVHDDVVVVAVTGEIDLSNVEDIREGVLKAVPNFSRGVVVDLSKTAYMDSQGIKMLLDLAHRLGIRRQKIHLVVEEAGVLRSLLTLMAIPKVIPMAGTTADAIRACRAEGIKPENERS
jgi:anti-anti-sigma factor